MHRQQMGFQLILGNADCFLIRGVAEQDYHQQSNDYRYDNHNRQRTGQQG